MSSGWQPQADDSLPFVSVVVPVRNEERYIGRSLRSILAQDYPSHLVEVLVADGMSDDGTRELIRELQTVDRRLRLVDNPGRIVSLGLNIALPLALGTVIVRVDGHCEIDAAYVRRAVAHLSDRSVAAVGGPLLTIGETPVARMIATAMSSRFGVGDSTFRVGGFGTSDVDTVAFPGYSRSALSEAGPFDEELVRNQDDEYSYRLRAMGYRIVFAPDMRAVYYSRGTLRSLWRQYFQYGYWKVRVMQKHPRQMRIRQFVPPLFVAAMAGAVAAATMTWWGWMTLAAVLIAYAAANLAASILAAGRTGWRAIAMLSAAFATLHLSYGSGFLAGLCRFGPRALIASDRAERERRMPERTAWL